MTATAMCLAETYDRAVSKYRVSGITNYMAATVPPVVSSPWRWPRVRAGSLSITCTRMTWSAMFSVRSNGRF
jgi:hypothetical protein